MVRIAFHTLGCKSNQYETSEIIRRARSLGFEVTGLSSKADFYIINTCTVTELADKKSLKAIRQAKKNNPNATIIVTGCLSEVHRDTKLKDVALIVRNADKQDILNKLPHPAFRTHDHRQVEVFRVRENLMIEDGCEEFCNYCIVPFARGKVRVKAPGIVLAEAEKMVNAGVKEIVLTGINLGAYGSKLPLLLKKLSKIEGLLRLRLSSIEPMYVTSELIKTIARTPKVCRHLNIPLQSGSSRVLKLMGRKYGAEDFLLLIKQIRSEIKGVALNTDVIAGYPGETDKDFEGTIKLLRSVKFSRIHAFHYSERPGTLASKGALKTEPQVTAKRGKELRALRMRLMKDFAKAAIKSSQVVLVESKDKRTGLLEGLTESYIRVFLKGPEGLIGRLVPVRITKLKNEDGIGELI